MTAACLQAGTTHNLGTNFAKAFGTQFLDETGTRQHVFQTSFGMSTRMIGGIIMIHGDDSGLRLPPRMAPVQVCPCLALISQHQKLYTVSTARLPVLELLELDLHDQGQPHYTQKQLWPGAQALHGLGSWVSATAKVAAQ